MATVRFTQNIQRHVSCPPEEVKGRSLGAVLEAYFGLHPEARGYVLDDQGALRFHMVVFVDGEPLVDRERLSDEVETMSQIYVMQALSGG